MSSPYPSPATSTQQVLDVAGKNSVKYQYGWPVISNSELLMSSVQFSTWQDNFSCMDMIIHWNRTRLKGAAALCLPPRCCYCSLLDDTTKMIYVLCIYNKKEKEHQIMVCPIANPSTLSRCSINLGTCFKFLQRMQQT